MEKSQKITLAVMAVLIVVLGASSVYFYKQYAAIKANPQKVAQETVNDLVGKVGKLISLPTSEQPTVATVVEPDKLKDQPFFAKAKAGDKVLIYTNSRKAILYSVSQDIILEVAPLTIGDQKAAPIQPKVEAATSTR